MTFRPLKKKTPPKSSEPLETVFSKSAAFLTLRTVPAERREEALLLTIRAYAVETGPRLGPVIVFALLEELVPGLGRAARAYVEGYPATEGRWDGCLFDAGVPVGFSEALNPSPFMGAIP